MTDKSIIAKDVVNGSLWVNLDALDNLNLTDDQWVEIKRLAQLEPEKISQYLENLKTQSS